MDVEGGNFGCYMLVNFVRLFVLCVLFVLFVCLFVIDLEKAEANSEAEVEVEAKAKEAMVEGKSDKSRGNF